MSIQDLTVGTPPPKPLSLGGSALFLDLDGTLAPIAVRPGDVGPDPRRTSLIERLAVALHGRLAVVSGRGLADLDRILEGVVTAVAAVHGLVRRDAAGRVFAAAPHPQLPAAAAGFHRFAERDAGLLVEEKGLSVALHFRRAEPQAEAAQACARTLRDSTGLVLQQGDMVEELRTPGADKGDSVRAFMAEQPFAGARPVFLGDDATDEDGFAAAHSLGGMGVMVGARRLTGAQFRLPDVEAALAWLEAAL